MWSELSERQQESSTCPISPPETRASLLLRLPDAADVEAWDEFVTIYEPVLLRLARRLGMQNADAENLAQEVFLAIARSLEDWPGLGGWSKFLSQAITDKEVLANITVTRPDDGSSKVGDEITLQCKGDIGKRFLKKYTLNADAIVDFANLRMTSTKAFVERVEPIHIVLTIRESKGGRDSSGRIWPALPAQRLRVARSRIQEAWTPKGLSTDKQEHRWKEVELNEFDLDMIEVVEQKK